MSRTILEGESRRYSWGKKKRKQTQKVKTLWSKKKKIKEKGTGEKMQGREGNQGQEEDQQLKEKVIIKERHIQNEIAVKNSGIQIP